MAVTMNDIAKLRKLTGAGMMDCKKALAEADGDFDKAYADAKVDADIAAADAALVKAATGDGLAFFQKKLAEYTAEYQKIKDDQEVAYGAKVKSDLDGAIKDENEGIDLPLVPNN